MRIGADGRPRLTRLTLLTSPLPVQCRPAPARRCPAPPLKLPRISQCRGVGVDLGSSVLDWRVVAWRVVAWRGVAWRARGVMGATVDKRIVITSVCCTPARCSHRHGLRGRGCIRPGSCDLQPPPPPPHPPLFRLSHEADNQQQME